MLHCYKPALTRASPVDFWLKIHLSRKKTEPSAKGKHKEQQEISFGAHNLYNWSLI